MDDNSCFNDLWIDGNDIFTLLQAIEGREPGHVVLPDFNNIIPMPQELDVDICTVPEHCAIAIAKENFEEFFNSNWAKFKSITTIDGLCEFLKTHWGGMSTIETVKRCGNMFCCWDSYP